MSRVCQFCGKSTQVGRSIARRGLAKSKGGVGRKTTGITKRRFLPNLHSVRVLEGGGVVRRRVCAACIKGGKVTKV